MYLQKALTKSIKTDYIVEMVQMVSGLLLVLFLWTHMVFVASIIVGVGSFSALASFMDRYELVPVTAVVLVFIFAAHIGAIMRHLPARWAEQKVAWRHAKLIRHKDTWSWLFQIVTGMGILLFAFIHIVAVTYGGISVSLSKGRIDNPGFLIFYAVLLLISEYHASVGLYRIFVKWGYLNRHRTDRVLGAISILMILVGFVTLGVFLTLKLVGGGVA